MNRDGATMDGTLQGKTALVTGASRGIGLAVARELARAGAWVGMVARTEAELARAAAGAGGHAIAADVTSPAAVHGLVGYVTELLGDTPDLLVNSAGAFALAPLAATDPEAFERQIAVNLRGPFLLIRALLPLMLNRRSGHVVNIGSVAGRVAFPENGAYAASKFGLRGLHEVLAQEVRGTGVRATLVEPGATDTSLWDAIDPDSRDDLPSRTAMLSPDDVARAVLFAASQPAGVEIPVVAVQAAG
ncbi:MAG TPA: SDR family oxidoreductase [Longimicrobiaceae bacterium]|nr:SDR family oxidoreductase [Longimicrobiaceae bacterium]